jgi:ABC-2 type transport system ATP-binding protein
MSVGGGRPIVVRGLVKRYGALTAVDGVDLTVEPGDVYGFLGPNGAGKTTTMRMLLGLVRRDGGSIELFGHDPAQDPIRAIRGVAAIIEEPRLYPYLSGRTNLELLAALDRGGVDRSLIDEVLDKVELRGRAGERVAGYSQGMRQRLGIASCLIRRPRMLMLDEPANGVDPAGIRYLRSLIRSLADQGTTILLSSHLLTEVQEVCNRVSVINDGRIVYEGPLIEMGVGPVPRYRLRVTDTARAADLCRGLPGLRELRFADGGLSFTLDDNDAAVRLTRALADAGVGITGLGREQDTLERLFFRLTESESGQQSTATAVG